MKLYVGGGNKNLKKMVKLGVQYVLCYCLILHGLTRHIANITADSLVNPLMPTALLMTTRDRFSYFRSGVVDKYLGGGGGGAAANALAGAWWQRPEKPRKMFNKTCFLGLHGGI